MKKQLIHFLLILLIFAIWGGSLIAEEKKVYLSGDFNYLLLKNGTVEISGYKGKASELHIPDKIDNYTVTSIGKNAFFFSDIISVTIPDSVQNIEELAFFGCSNLTNLTIPDSVTSVGDSAFLWCSKLKNVTIGMGVMNINGNPFSQCDSLLELNVSDDHPYLDVIDNVLIMNTENRLICYPAALSATAYNIPNGIQSIGNKALDRCVNLASINIPETVTNIGDWAFSECSNLNNVNIPNSVTSLGNWAFLNCKGLSSVIIGSSLEHLGNNPFANCDSLSSIVLSLNHPYLELIDNVLFSKSEKRLICYPNALPSQSYTIPIGTKSIGNNAFANCEKLTSIIISEGIGTIGSAAFMKCNKLVNINIPKSVTNIGSHAFSSCSNLTNLFIPENVTNIEDGAFYSCDNLTLTVSRDSYAEKYAKENEIPYIYVDTGDALQNIEPPPIRILTLSGEGAKIIDNIELPFAPYRVTFTQDIVGSQKVSYMSGDRVRTLIDEKMSIRQCVVFVYSGTYDFTIESVGKWELIFESLIQADNLNISGIGDYVSDIFTIPKSTIINISGTYGDFENFIIYAYTLGNYGWSSDLLVNNLDDSGKVEAFQKIITIAKETQVFFTIDFDSGNWLIKSGDK